MLYSMGIDEIHGGDAYIAWGIVRVGYLRDNLPRPRLVIALVVD
jgi:hypothetical protein